MFSLEFEEMEILGSLQKLSSNCGIQVLYALKVRAPRRRAQRDAGGWQPPGIARGAVKKYLKTRTPTEWGRSFRRMLPSLCGQVIMSDRVWEAQSAFATADFMELLWQNAPFLGHVFPGPVTQNRNYPRGTHRLMSLVWVPRSCDLLGSFPIPHAPDRRLPAAKLAHAAGTEQPMWRAIQTEAVVQRREGYRRKALMPWRWRAGELKIPVRKLRGLVTSGRPNPFLTP